MRRNMRRSEPEEKSFSIKNTLYIAGTILALGIIAFVITVMVYNNSVDKLYDELGTREIAKVDEENTVNAEEANADIGKTVEIAQTEENEETTAIQTDAENDEITTTGTETADAEKVVGASSARSDSEESAAKESSTHSDSEETTKSEETKKTLSFIMPVDGDIQKEYAKDNLIYSDTLKEWVTHTGIDIKAVKTSVVKASEEGKVTAIKNDPRYGITVIIEHSDGYETRYANLLTAEFVSIGEEVSKGQTIGTVGDTGAFEILDEPHLHFEILKDGEYLDPMTIIK